MALAFLLAGPLLGWVAYRVASSYEQERLRMAFEARLSMRSALLQKEVFDIAEDLHHLRAFFSAQDVVSRAEFRKFTQEILESNPAIHAIEWIPRIVAGRREEHERSARADGLEGYRIQVRLPDGSMVTAPPSPEYYPVFYVEPLPPNERAIGYDLASEKGRRSALDLAAATQKIALTDPIDLVQEPGSAKGILAFLPVYRQRLPQEADDPLSLDGFVLFVLDVREMVAKSLLLGGGPPFLKFQLFDVDVAGKIVAVEASPDWDPSHVDDGSVFVRSIVIGNQGWELQGLPTASFVAEHLSHQPAVLGVGVFLLWGVLIGLGLSLAERAQMQGMRKQDQVFRSVCHSLTEGVAVAGVDGRLIVFNEAAEKIFGLGLKDVPQTEWASIYGCYFPDMRTPFPTDRLPLVRAIRGESVQGELMYVRNSSLQEGIWISVSSAPLTDEEGGPAGGLAVFRDISRFKKADEELRSTLKQLEDMKTALDQSAIVATTDREGAIIYVNDKFCEISGYSRAELMGQNHRIVNSGYHPKAFFEKMWQTIGGGQVWRETIRNRAKDGRHFWVDTTIVPFRDQNGEPEHYLAIHNDITESRKHQETAEHLSNAIEQTADGVFITNRDGVIEYVNPAFETTTGYSRTEALGNTPRILKSGAYDSNHYKELWQRILNGEVYRHTTVNRRKNGELYNVEQTITPMRDSEARVTHFVSVLKDVTERIKRQEQEIEMHLAAQVQKRLYPEQPPQMPGFDIAGAVFPAEATCGDYFDYLPIKDGILGIAIGDVCGHGLGPALIMAETRAFLRSLSRGASDLGGILSAINESLHPDLDEVRFVTLLLAHINVSARRLTYANAGHTPGYVLDRTGALKAELKATGLPLGMFPTSKYEADGDVGFEPGDMVVLLTDGITESQAPDGSWFEGERVLDVLRKHLNEPAEHIVLHVRRAVFEFTQGAKPSDDLTIVVCKAVAF